MDFLGKISLTNNKNKYQFICYELYVAALNHALVRLAEGFPLPLRLIREIHEVLFSKGRGADMGRLELFLYDQPENPHRFC
jgi:hypothetical protein